MARWAQLVLLKDDPAIVAAYEAYHAQPWPEVSAAMRAQGIQRAFIFRFAQTLCMVIETDDNQQLRDMPEAIRPRIAAWDALMNAMQQPVPGAPPGGTWVRMQEIFTFEA